MSDEDTLLCVKYISSMSIFNIMDINMLFTTLSKSVRGWWPGQRTHYNLDQVPLTRDPLIVPLIYTTQQPAARGGKCKNIYWGDELLIASCMQIADTQSQLTPIRLSLNIWWIVPVFTVPFWRGDFIPNNPYREDDCWHGDCSIPPYHRSLLFVYFKRNTFP